MTVGRTPVETALELAEETGIGGCRVYNVVVDSDGRFPVPTGSELDMGTGTTVTSVVTVVVPLSESMLLDGAKDEEDKEETESEDCDSEELSSNDSQKEDHVSEDCRDSSSGVLLEDEEDGVGAAGAVVFVTIWRLTCLGK